MFFENNILYYMLNLLIGTPLERCFLSESYGILSNKLAVKLFLLKKIIREDLTQILPIFFRKALLAFLTEEIKLSKR